MNDLELLTDGLFLPLSFHASFSDIRKRTISSRTEFMLLLCGFLMAAARISLSGIGDPVTLIVNNSLPLVLLLIGSVFGKTGFGDFEYALSMALFYPCLCEVSSFTPIRGIFEPIWISTSVLSIALVNAILIAWLILFAMNLLKWLKEHNFPSRVPLAATLAAALTIPVLIPRSLLLTPFLSKLAHEVNTQKIELPLVPLMFIGFVAARFGHIMLM